jgi:hypothetical protein
VVVEAEGDEGDGPGGDGHFGSPGTAFISFLFLNKLLITNSEQQSP